MFGWICPLISTCGPYDHLAAGKALSNYSYITCAEAINHPCSIKFAHLYLLVVPTITSLQEKLCPIIHTLTVLRPCTTQVWLNLTTNIYLWPLGSPRYRKKFAPLFIHYLCPDQAPPVFGYLWSLGSPRCRISFASLFIHYLCRGPTSPVFGYICPLISTCGP